MSDNIETKNNEIAPSLANADVNLLNEGCLTHASAPVVDYGVANKKYVDDNAGGGGGGDIVLSIGEMLIPGSNYPDNEQVSGTNRQWLKSTMIALDRGEWEGKFVPSAYNGQTTNIDIWFKTSITDDSKNVRFEFAYKSDAEGVAEDTAYTTINTPDKACKTNADYWNKVTLASQSLTLAAGQPVAFRIKRIAASSDEAGGDVKFRKAQVSFNW